LLRLLLLLLLLSWSLCLLLLLVLPLHVLLSQPSILQRRFRALPLHFPLQLLPLLLILPELLVLLILNP
jgi:hypothetical protein